MSILIKGMEMPKRGHTITITIVGNGQTYVEYFDCRPHVKETIEYTAVHVPAHGRLIDADEFLQRALGTKCFRGDYALMLEELVGESTTVIPASGGK